ncbi:MAG: leucine-rich repeat protein, partial [Oscillospiraceae bacterium]|nr:leucine-rich repeat protein [Oscillospiraceae bacterium]
MRLISFALAVLIMFSAFPMQVFAAEEENNEILWEQGTIASVDGTNNSTKTRFRTADYLLLESYSGVSIGSGYTMTNFVYDAEYNYLGTSSWLGDGIPFTTAELSKKYPSGIYFRVVFRTLDQRNLTEEDVISSGVKFYFPEEEVPAPDFGFTYEDMGKIGVWQDGDIHDGKLFVFGAAGSGEIFDLRTLEKLGGITLDKKETIKPHANSVCFGSTYYEPGDKYPLLYINIYNNYAEAEDRMEGTCCVYRLLETEGNFSTELVQVIKVGFTDNLTLWKSKENNGDVRPYGNFVVDTDENRLYAIVMRDADKTIRFFEFAIPEIGEGTYSESYGCNVVTLETDDIKSRFDSENYNYLQGCCYYGRKILCMCDFGGDAPLHIIDLEKQKVVESFCLGYAGLRAEPEVICVDDSDGTLYYCAADGMLRKIVFSERIKNPCGPSAFWKLENGVLKIYGSGEMEDYADAQSVPWRAQSKEITSVVIEEGITSIGSTAFAQCENLVSANLPEGLEKIGKNAIWGCTALNDITLPQSLEEIGQSAFFKCSALDYIVIPSSVKTLEKAVFGQCENLDTIVLHDDITAIESEAFSRCYALRHISLPKNLKKIGYHAFFGCAQLEQLTFPETFAEIEDAAFYGCSDLAFLRFTGSAPLFAEKSLMDITANVYYPDGDASWEETVKQNYGGTITWLSECYHNYKHETTEPTCTEQGYTTHACTICGESYVDNYTEPAGHSFGEWYTVKEATFTEDGEECRECIKCSHVEFRSVPLTVVTSGNVGYGTPYTDDVIYTLYSNGTMVISGNGIVYCSDWRGDYQPYKDYRAQVKTLIIEEGISATRGGCFAHFYNLETVTLPDSLTKIDGNAFMSSFSSSVTNIVIPETVTFIGSYCYGFYYGNGGTTFTDVIIENPNVILPANNTAFNAGSNLENLTLYSYGTDNNVSAYAEKYGCKYVDLEVYKTGEFEGINYAYYDGVLTLSTEGENMSIPSDAPWNEYKSKITKIEIESGIIGISANAFADYAVLEKVELPDSIKSIGNCAFSVSESCSKEISMVIPRRIETVGKNIFENRSNVKVTAYLGSPAAEIDEPGVELTVKKQFKFLMIGNSYTEDASSCGQGMTESQLFNILQAMLGEDTEIVLGAITSGGKGINWHATKAEENTGSYSFKIVTSENRKWKSMGSISSAKALAYTDWDAVSLQVYNVNVNTGEESVSYPEQTDPKFYKLEDASEFMLDHIAKHAPYADAYFYMHWSQTSSIALNAALSGYNRLANYIPVVLDYAGTETGKQFENIVPVGLSVQNARTTYLALLAYNTTAYADGNLNLYTDAQIGLQRDGGHLSFNIGRYIAGLTFAEMVIPEEMREEGYVLPDIRVTESIGKLPKEYTEIAQKSVFAAVES